MTKEELQAKLTAAIGDTGYGKQLTDELLADFGSKYNAKDRLDDRAGYYLSEVKKHHDAGDNTMAAAEAEKLLIVEKALAAIA